MKDTATLLISCPDRKGLVAAIANFLYTYNANILHADQHQDDEGELFLMRIEWDLQGFTLDLSAFDAAFSPIADRFGMRWQLQRSSQRKRVAIFVSHYDHCLVDLLHRWQTGELDCDIPLIVSNHETCRRIAEFHGIDFQYIDTPKGQKPMFEQAQRELLAAYRIDLIVLARYMQVLSPEFTAAWPQRVINIHHSFLPAFDGAKPYHRAYERGVKLIGATSHYVTDVLDDGPIIEQDVVRISHRDSVADLIQKGRDLERIVLSRALRWHLDNRVLVFGNKTVVFD
ncbi:formyltetrahydrofolate deformylase [Burkholderiaceae bacterium DAT-1]|nr:formyltetrahydrofolate deformylase [Burkholderiaceae bacterium DAT-1]